MSIRKIRKVYLENAGWLLKLRDKAVKERRWFEAYLLTFFRIELGLILLIDLKMTTTGETIYSNRFLKRIINGKLRFAELIDIFCLLYGDRLYQGLNIIRNDRNDFVHNFYKKSKVDFEKYVKDINIKARLIENELGKIIHEELAEKEGSSSKNK